MISAVHSDFVITVAQEGMSGVYSRAVTDETYTTNFEEGDEIGLFAVKDGRIKDDFNNVKVSLNDGNWKIADKTFFTKRIKNSVRFISLTIRIIVNFLSPRLKVQIF